MHWEKAAGALSYEVWRSPNDQFSSAIRLGETRALSIDDTTALPGSVYTYWARAINPSARSGFGTPDRGYRATAQADLKVASLVWLPRMLAPGQQPDIVSWVLENNGPNVARQRLAMRLWL